jgi:hypothetical protein
MIYVLIHALSFQCMVDSMKKASETEIGYKWKIVKSYPEKKKRLSKILKHSWKNNNVDSRILALSWIESRLRPNVRVGDQGKACGTFQIHARYSYPMFRRKGGWKNWKEGENKNEIQKECKKLRNVKYSVNTLRRLLKILDKKNLHSCHHNSGIYGKCNVWYKKRVDFWINYFNYSKYTCYKQNKPIEVNEALVVYYVYNILSSYISSLNII